MRHSPQLSRGYGRRTVVLLAITATVVGVSAQSRLAVARLVGEDLPATVTSVADGDTVTVRLERTGQIVKVRLEGIDAPENGEPFSGQARSATRVMLFDKRVQLRATDLDRYNRLVARITTDGKDSSLELVKAGLACHFTRYSVDPALAAAEMEAKASRRGFWDPGASKPACARNRNDAVDPVKGSGPFHGNRQSHVFHSSLCVNYNCTKCTVSFPTMAEAAKAGFRPAGDCLPSR